MKPLTLYRRVLLVHLRLQRADGPPEALWVYTEAERSSWT